jgi:hypothetical protein
MGLGEDISFQQIFIRFLKNEETYILGLCYTIKKPIFLNENQMIYVQMYLAYMKDLCREQIQMHNIF